MKNLLFAFLFIGASALGNAQETTYETISNLQYYDSSIAETDAYIKERCMLDLYYPKDLKDFPTIVWFHGGGLTGGEKFIPEELKNKGVAIVAVNYRLNPKVNSPSYIEDAAAATNWVFKNISDYGGDPSLLFISGHSAGGYLASMIVLDKSYLAKYNIDSDSVAGFIPFSGHAITHMTVRKEREIDEKQPIIDSLAPLFHVRKDAPPLLLMTGDRDLELLGRYEEVAYFMRMMKLVGHENTTLYELDGYDHGGMAVPAFPLLLKEVDRITKLKKE
ncbi:Acetyl esterase/lipase [Flavobacteriaceae bacterium MAR_2010_188]|nr:Acetyl esterase/lipase [Flavobacteriaceae bacterium MAR_2010_188]